MVEATDGVEVELRGGEDSFASQKKGWNFLAFYFVYVRLPLPLSFLHLKWCNSAPLLARGSFCKAP